MKLRSMRERKKNNYAVIMGSASKRKKKNVLNSLTLSLSDVVKVETRRIPCLETIMKFLVVNRTTLVDRSQSQC